MSDFQRRIRENVIQCLFHEALLKTLPQGQSWFSKNHMSRQDMKCMRSLGELPEKDKV